MPFNGEVIAIIGEEIPGMKKAGLFVRLWSKCREKQTMVSCRFRWQVV